jgi:hypothetical protein
MASMLLACQRSLFSIIPVKRELLLAALFYLRRLKGYQWPFISPLFGQLYLSVHQSEIDSCTGKI